MTRDEEIRKSAGRFFAGCLSSKKRSWKHLSTTDGEGVLVQAWLSGADPARFRVLFDAQEPRGRISLVAGREERVIGLSLIETLADERHLLLALDETDPVFNQPKSRQLMLAAYEAVKAGGAA